MNIKTPEVLIALDTLGERLQSVADNCSDEFAQGMQLEVNALAGIRAQLSELMFHADKLADFPTSSRRDKVRSVLARMTNEVPAHYSRTVQ